MVSKGFVDPHHFEVERDFRELAFYNGPRNVKGFSATFYISARNFFTGAYKFHIRYNTHGP